MIRHLELLVLICYAESDRLFLRRVRGLQQPLDVLEEDSDLFIVLGHLAGQLLVRRQHADKGPHDMATFTEAARLLRSTEDSMATPCSVKTRGAYRRPPRPVFEVPIWNLKASHSSVVRWNMKSSGKRS